MSLFIIRHQHDVARYPAQDPYLGAALRNYLSRPNVVKHGVKIQGEAVVRGEHTMFMIAEAEDETGLSALMAPFRQAGSVDVFPASTSAGLITNNGFARPSPAIGEVPALDPEEACQDAIDAGLVVHRAHPLNGETSVPALIGGVIMPNARFYVRNHFQIPNFNVLDYRLAVGGLVKRKLSLSLRDLTRMPSQTFLATLECAGNGRTKFDPPTAGEKWDLGAVSTAEWTGVSLTEVLDRAGIDSAAREVLFRGADYGTVEDSSGTIHYERSLRLEEVARAGAILAYVMNGEPLPIHHGFPLRLIVPSWYAVASVKWLTDIELIGHTFAGHFQTKKYWYEWDRCGEDVREPVTRMQVRALITEPSQGAEIERGDIAIRGVAWSGLAPIERVEVSTSGAWHKARLIGEPSPKAWQRWELVTGINATGPALLRVRATDNAGRVQLEHAEWNRLGYGNNSIQEVAIRVV
jgi:DMSO/TMAO reductase YedYZ molybdopterin-dependent catalytic subunit